MVIRTAARSIRRPSDVIERVHADSHPKLLASRGSLGPGPGPWLAVMRRALLVLLAYAQCILKSIKGKPLFHFIDLEIKEYWDYLVLWMATFLSIRLQPTFRDWVVEFIELMRGIKRPATGSDPTATPRLTQLPLRNTAAGLAEDATGQIILGKAFEKPGLYRDGGFARGG
ncbi:hypothetical protein MYCTH_2111310 [Thermothelomyces thermophilus ATCC 42464]|uniref:DNA polymerase epsilon catalytic subunit A C-terminal domain-containing protein n=1 Tax=Thermothelomyces thermophilus (strain ATCC 42464 / BCRC 31852 / DSM 1799) TaxID=573729 RepID=G2QF42_THET4|nr:uncharacterized protein MYCTH_2111310 [Thermothelomyces thermophilus ATCC 42464]AEO59071.1 hypothetical protein MYCTH_2111310 [Thermothelomyces thermophilus ATCC 42464]